MNTVFRNRAVKYLSLIVCLAVTVGCSNSDSTNSVVRDFQVVITGVSFDYGSSEISLANSIVVDDESTVSVDESELSYDIVNGFAGQDLSDIKATTYGNNFYRLGSSSQDNLTKYSFDNPGLVEWQFSINSEGETGSNPHDLVFISETKAYVIRYGSSSILIINPSVSANDEDNFQVGEIDLSAYDVDGIPNMHRGVIHNDILYVVVQALDSSYTPRDAYLTAIDTKTDKEISIGSNTLKGLALTVRNPIDLDLLGDDLYVSAIGRYGSSDPTSPRDPEYTGGIEKINLGDYTSQLLVDDGSATTHPFGQINGLALVSDTIGYFIGYDGWKDNSLYRFNPSTGNVEATALSGFSHVNIMTIEASPEGELWVGIGDDVTPKIQVISPENNEVKESILTDKNPVAIAFRSELSED